MHAAPKLPEGQKYERASSGGCENETGDCLIAEYDGNMMKYN